MVHIEITIRDEQGDIINQATQVRYELGNRLSNLNEIERAVDQLKQAMLPALESDLLSRHQQEIIEGVKKKSIDKV